MTDVIEWDTTRYLMRMMEDLKCDDAREEERRRSSQPGMFFGSSAADVPFELVGKISGPCSAREACDIECCASARHVEQCSDEKSIDVELEM